MLAKSFEKPHKFPVPVGLEYMHSNMSVVDTDHFGHLFVKALPGNYVQ
jgi:hypothetical protein